MPSAAHPVHPADCGLCPLTPVNAGTWIKGQVGVDTVAWAINATKADDANILQFMWNDQVGQALCIKCNLDQMKEMLELIWIWILQQWKCWTTSVFFHWHWDHYLCESKGDARSWAMLIDVHTGFRWMTTGLHQYKLHCSQLSSAAHHNWEVGADFIGFCCSSDWWEWVNVSWPQYSGASLKDIKP